ncbi:NERD domain-containing protein [Bacillus infantis]|uniref:NERD domain-containing protein n=1 Tax=Bacillus infantis TaxID=324767 RepID=A0A5D4SC38_9BACI|nr:nuclease-related domain-containing protein [Bacillus infantis]TYS60539.1 NERD domain-containing protein [Bacillus infantis]
MFLNLLLKNKKNRSNKNIKPITSPLTKTDNDQIINKNEQIAHRKGEIGEYKIDIQLSQLPKEYMHLSDILIKNPKSSTGYSQIDHIIITSYGLFVIETKNYQGTIYGDKDRKYWLINGKFKMMNPLMQNYGHIQAIKGSIDTRYHKYFISMVSFTKRCTFKIEEELRTIKSNDLVVYDVELTEFIKRKVAVLKLQYYNPVLVKEDIKKIYNSISGSNIIDESIRKQHVESIQIKKSTSDNKNDKNQCVICQKSVSEKVKSYCLSNNKFKGNIYCFKHQETVVKGK